MGRIRCEEAPQVVPACHMHSHVFTKEILYSNFTNHYPLVFIPFRSSLSRLDGGRMSDRPTALPLGHHEKVASWALLLLMMNTMQYLCALSCSISKLGPPALDDEDHAVFPSWSFLISF